jgi:2'-5' RNA ligase
MPRLFTGLEIPEDIALSLEGLRGGLPGARWIDPENYHITLRFIGDVDERRAADLEAGFARVRRPAFRVTLDGLGVFGSRRPHSIVAKVDHSAELKALHNEQEQIAQRYGLAPDPRKFTPHVTLARIRDVRPHAVADYIGLRSSPRRRSFEVSRFVLFSSRPSRGGGPYVIEQSYPLAVMAQSTHDEADAAPPGE